MLVRLGEVREVGIKVLSRLKEDFVIDVASYEIVNSNNEIVDDGFVVINGHILSILFTGSEKGNFNVIFKYHIGPEIIKAMVKVEVF